MDQVPHDGPAPDWVERGLAKVRADPRRRRLLRERLSAHGAPYVRPALAVVAAIYLALAAVHFVSLEPGLVRTAVLAANLITAVVLGTGAARLGNRVRPEATHALAFVVVLFPVANILLHMGLSGDPTHTTRLMLVAVACGAIFLELRWLVATLAVMIVGWIATAYGIGVLGTIWATQASVLALTLVVAGLVFMTRVHSVRRLEALNLELMDLIKIDELTGIPNRRGFDDRLAEVWEQLIHEGEPLAVIMCDLDHFKNLNDTRGHIEGDAALRQMAGVLRMVLRSTEDLPARLGGEEFGVLLPRTGKDQALLVAGRILEGLRFTRIPNPGAPSGDTLSVSLGLAVARPSPRLSPDDVLARADRALYEAKQRGRDRVYVEEGRKGPAPNERDLLPGEVRAPPG